MKRIATLLLSAALLSLSAGCHAQLPTVPQLSCPPATGATYAALNSGGTTSTSYTDSGMVSGASYCYVVQWLPTGVASGGTSNPSNIAGPVTSPTSSATHQTLLSWTAPGSGGAYVVSRVAAISTVPTAPSLLNGTSTASIPMPEPTIAMNEPLHLKARIGR